MTLPKRMFALWMPEAVEADSDDPSDGFMAFTSKRNLAEEWAIEGRVVWEWCRGDRVRVKKEAQ